MRRAAHPPTGKEDVMGPYVDKDHLSPNSQPGSVTRSIRGGGSGSSLQQEPALAGEPLTHQPHTRPSLVPWTWAAAARAPGVQGGAQTSIVPEAKILATCRG